MSESIPASLDFTTPEASGAPHEGRHEQEPKPGDRPEASAGTGAGGVARSETARAPAAAAVATRPHTTTPPAWRSQPADGPRRLVSSAQNHMLLHTRAAWWLFNGQNANAEGTVAPIVGARRFAWALRSIWLLTAHDNPYADWMLIRIDAELASLHARLGAAATRLRARLDALRASGLALSVLHSASPHPVALTFQSPYGYAAAALVVEFDACVRLVKTLGYADRLSDDEARAAVRSLARSIRGLFDRPIPWQRFLVRDAVRAHSRRDFLPQADSMARARVALLAERFGQVPAQILEGTEAPRHTRRGLRTADAPMGSSLDSARPPRPGVTVSVAGLL